MSVTITIAGSTKSIKAGSLNISQTANGRSTAAFSVISTDGTYRPAQDAEVIIMDGATREFAGLLEKPRERGMAGGKGIPAIVTSVSAADFNVYAERRYINEIFPEQTLKARLTTIVANYFTGYGVTLSGSQVDGPTLATVEYKYIRADEVLNQTVTLTAETGDPFVWKIDNFKVLSAFQPSTTPAPFNLTGDPIAAVLGDIEVESTFSAYANRIIIKLPQKKQDGRIETFTGDGTTGPFTLQYTPTKLYGHILVTSGGGETLGAPGDGGQWSYDDTTNSITRDAGVTTIGETYPLYFDGIFEGTAVAEDAGEIAAHGIHERVVNVESVPEDETADSLAAGYLAKSLTPTQTVKYKTHTAGILPGQSQSIVVSRRNLNGTAVISEVVVRDVGRNILERSVSAMIDGSQTNLGRGFRDVVKRWNGDLMGSGISSAPMTSVGAGGATSIGPALPKRSIQYHDNDNPGRFGGQAEFIFYQDEKSIVCGSDSAITAAAFSHCHIFGEFCEIADS